MIALSSSEDERDDSESSDADILVGRSFSPLPVISGGGDNTSRTFLSPIPPQRADSLSRRSSLAPPDPPDKLHLKLYVLVARCIAYPFANDQHVDQSLSYPKRTTESQLIRLRHHCETMLANADDEKSDEAFLGAVEIFLKRVLTSVDVETIVRVGGWTTSNFSVVFANMAKRIISELELSANLTMERVLNVWMQNLNIGALDKEIIHRTTSNETTFSSVNVMMNTDQLYEMFQEVLDVKKVEHLSLFNMFQLGHDDEQASAVRRELEARSLAVDAIDVDKIHQQFTKLGMGTLYKREKVETIANLMRLLDAKGGKGQSGQPMRNRRLVAIKRFAESDFGIAKSDIVMPFNVEVVVQEAGDMSLLNLSAKKVFYAVMKVDGCQEKMMTDRMEGNRPVWETEGNFATTVPRPHVCIELYTESSGFFEKVGVRSEDKRLAKIVLTPTTTNPIMLKKHKADCFGQSDKVFITASAKIDRPDTMKKSGFLYVKGTTCWKKWKLRYLCLVQVTQFKFALCCFDERHSDPKTVLQLKGFTVDYCKTEYLEGDGGDAYTFQFRTDREGDSLIMGCKDDRDRGQWVMALYRATGQQHKPTPVHRPLRTSASVDSSSQLLGLDDFLQADVTQLDHDSLFATLLNRIFDHRFKENTVNLGWLSPGQRFVLEEYCSRYGVRACHLTLCSLRELVERSWNGAIVDPSLFHYCYTFVEAHIHGFKPDSGHTGSVLNEEVKIFTKVKDDLKMILLRNVRNFWSIFPYGFPQGALKGTLSLLEKIMVIEKSSAAQMGALEHEISVCLKTAGLNAYASESKKVEKRLCQLNGVEELDSSTDLQNLDYLMELSNGIIWTCVEVESFYKDAFNRYPAALDTFYSTLWELYYGDLQAAVVERPKGSWDVFTLFHKVNCYLVEDRMCNSKSHVKMQELFLPLVVEYLTEQEEEMGREMRANLAAETWEDVANVKATHDFLEKITDLFDFVECLKWPDEDFRSHLETRVVRIAADTVESLAEKIKDAFMNCYQRSEFGRDLRYLLPQRVCTMIGAVQDLQTKALPLCQRPSIASKQKYRSDVGEAISGHVQTMKACLLLQLSSSINDLLEKLSRYDRDSLFSPFRRIIAPKMESIDPFSQFVNRNLGRLECWFVHELQDFMLSWYNVMVKRILDFVNPRTGSLQREQIFFIHRLLENLVANFLEYELSQSQLKSQLYTIVQSRIELELPSEESLEVESEE